jgi:hypothetical protein
MVFEQATYIRLIVYLHINKILVKQQFWFRKNLETQDTIYRLTNEILNALNNKTMVGSTLCDLEKAFWPCYHETLLIKLSHYEISG